GPLPALGPRPLRHRPGPRCRWRHNPPRPRAFQLRSIPMARVPYLTKDDLPEEHKALLARDIALNRALAHTPNGMRAFGTLGGFIRNTSTLDPRLREMAILQVGYLTRSRYEYSHHIKIGRDFGVSDDDI